MAKVPVMWVEIISITCKEKWFDTYPPSLEEWCLLVQLDGCCLLGKYIYVHMGGLEQKSGLDPG